MRVPYPLLAGILALTGIAAAQTGSPTVLPATDSDKIFALPYLMRTLDNGLRVIVVRTDTPGVVSLQIPVQTGSRNEVEPGKSGFAHFFEHMMFRGTPTYPAAAYQAVITQAGGDQNAYTSSDHTNYYINFTTADLEKMIEVEADRFQNLSYSEEQFRTEALAVKGEYLKNYSNPMLKGFETLAELAFDVHPYGHTTMGYLADIEAMPDQMAYAKTFFERWYRPEYTSVIVVGDVDPEATFNLVRKHWGGWQRGDYRVDIPVEPPLQGPKYEHLKWAGPTPPYLIHAWRGPALNADTPDTAALMLLNELYFGPTSELYQQVVVRERWADQFFSQPPTDKDPSLFALVARLTDAAHAPKVVQAIEATLVQTRSQPVDAARLAQTKSRMKYSFAATLNSANTLAATLAGFVHYQRTPEILNDLYRQFDALQPADLIAAANRVFTDSNRASVSIASSDDLPGANDFGSIDAAVAAAGRTAGESSIPVLALPSSAAMVNVTLLFNTGAAFDPPGKAGLAALTAAMLADGGSAQRSYADLQQAFYPIASGLTAQVDKEMLRLSGSVHRDNLDAWYGLVREMLLQPGFREDDFTRLKQQHINAIRVSLRGNNDEELGKEALYEMVYGPEHPYGRLNLGHVADLESITLDDVRHFYRTQLTPQRLRIGLSGGYDDGFQQRLISDFNRLPQGEAADLAIATPVLARARSARILEKETQSVAVSFGWPIDLRRGHRDWAALWLVRSYLGEHRNSAGRLYLRIREERGMNYGNYAYIEYFPAGMFRMQPEPNHARRNDLFQVWLRPLRSNNDALFATRAALHELDRLLEDGLSEEEFQASRAFLRKFVAILTAAPSTRLGYALDSQWFETAEFGDYVRSELDKLDLEQVNAAIRRYLKPEAAQFVFVAKDAHALADALGADTPSPIEYNSEKPAELLAEDAVIAKRPLQLPAARVQVIAADTVFE